VIRVVEPGGQPMQSRPIALVLDDGSQTVLIALLTNSVGELTASNEVTYPNAFEGLASLRFKNTQAGLEQDVLIQGQLPASPSALGLNEAKTKIGVLTEFFDTADPAQTPGPVNPRDGLSDPTLTFGGTMALVHGRAFFIGGGGSGSAQNSPSRLTSAATGGTPTYKSWLKLNGLTFLLEQIPYEQVAPQLEQLPPMTGRLNVSSTNLLAANSLLNRIPAGLLSPPAPGGQAGASKMRKLEMARTEGEPARGLVLDYNLLDSDQGDFTFASGQTYFISGWVNIGGTATFEAGTVLKFPEDGSGSISFGGSVACQTIPFDPAVFTSENDNSAGESLPWSSGTPGQIQAGMDFSASSVELDHCRLSYFGSDTTAYGDITFNDVQFTECTGPVLPLGNMAVNNSLITDSWLLCDGNMNCENVTFDNCYAAADFDSTFTNCIFSRLTAIVTNIAPDQDPPNAYGSHNGFDYEAAQAFGDNPIIIDYIDTPPFAAGPLGHYYLAPGGEFIDAGSVTADRLGLYWWTTQPGGQNIEGTSIVDLGFHYPAVDGYGNPIDSDGDGVPDYQEDANGNGLPDQWELDNLGGLNHYASELDAYGNTLLYDYTNDIDLTGAIQFTAFLGTQHFNTPNATGSYWVQSGYPGYEAVLVNDTNLNDAVWQPYDGNISMALGPTDGAYLVEIGLRGYLTNAPPAWIGVTVYLDRTAPQVMITSPSNNLTMATPYLQLRGCASKLLQGVTFDLSNAVSFVTNQPGNITGRYFDTNAFAFTTNYFQCVDVLLTNGLNTIAVHATDLAGNVTTTNLNITLDYATATNPVVALYWPQNNTVIIGTNFTLRGWVNDASAQVFAQIVDTNGDTNIVMGTVERDGKIWVQYLPLPAGTNYLTLTVTNAAGLSSETNIVVVKSLLNMTINPVTGNLWLPTTTVTGTIGDPADYTVWVNGVKVTVTGNNWEADNVPLPSGGGAAAIQARAIPNTDNGGNGTGGSGGGPVTFDNLGNPGQDDDLETGVLPRQTGVVVDAAKWSSDADSWIDEGPIVVSGNYTFGGGGQVTEDWPGGDMDKWVLAPGGAVINHYFDGVEDTNNIYWQDYPGYGLENGSLGYTEDEYDYWDRTTEVHLALLTGGLGVAGQQAVVSVNTSAQSEQAVDNMYEDVSSTPIPSQLIRIPGLNKNLGSDGWAYGTTTIGGPPVDVTPTVGLPAYSFTWPDAPVSVLTILANGVDLSTNTPKFCVGQNVNFTTSWDGPSPNIATVEWVHWHLPEKFVNESYGIPTFNPVCITYWKNPALLEGWTTHCWYVNGQGGACSIGTRLQMSNGQEVNVAASGSFIVFRPKISSFVVDNNIHIVLDTNAMPDIYLGLGDNAGGGMGWTLKVDLNTNFPGSLFFDQLIDREWSWDREVWYGYIPKSDHTGGYKLDNGSPYKAASIIQNTGSHTNMTMVFGDGPDLEDTLHSFADTPDSFQTYLLFQPSGGIAVTIGLISWGWHGRTDGSYSTSTWTLTPTANPITGPTVDYNNDSFPVWTDVYHNTGGD
jgi:hypothetical protein